MIGIARFDHLKTDKFRNPRGKVLALEGMDHGRYFAGMLEDDGANGRTGQGDIMYIDTNARNRIKTSGPGIGRDLAAGVDEVVLGAGVQTGEVYLVGSARKPNGETDAVLLVLEQNGQLRQRLIVGGPGNQSFRSVAAGDDGSVYAVGIKADRPMLVRYVRR